MTATRSLVARVDFDQDDCIPISRPRSSISQRHKCSAVRRPIWRRVRDRLCTVKTGSPPSHLSHQPTNEPNCPVAVGSRDHDPAFRSRVGILSDAKGRPCPKCHAQLTIVKGHKRSFRPVCAPFISIQTIPMALRRKIMCFGAAPKDDPLAKKSRDIEKQLREDQRRLAKEVKLLLLGEEMATYAKARSTQEILTASRRWRIWQIHCAQADASDTFQGILGARTETMEGHHFSEPAAVIPGHFRRYGRPGDRFWGLKKHRTSPCICYMAPESLMVFTAICRGRCIRSRDWH